MKALLGFLLLSVFLTSGYSLECETCMSTGNTCSGKKQACVAGQDVCLSAVTEVSVGGTTVNSVVKSCFSKESCKDLKPGSTAKFAGAGATILSVQCNKGPVLSGSFALALSGLLLLKLLC